MAINQPTQVLLDQTNSDLGAASVAGGYAYTFNLPSDVTTIAVRFRPSVVTGHMSATLQTSPDGGTNYYDVARTSVMSAANATTAQWLSASTIMPGVRTAVIQSASVISAGIGSAAASTLGSQQVSGLPIMGTANRIFLILGGDATVNNASRVEVFATGQMANSN